jgi:hypothetical protein
MAALLVAGACGGGCASESRLVSVSEGPPKAPAPDGGAPAAAAAAAASARPATPAEKPAEKGEKPAEKKAEERPAAKPAAESSGTAAVPAAGGPRHPQASAAVETCNRAWRDAGGATPDAVVPGVVNGCLDLYQAKPCRDAWQTMADAPSDKRPRALAQVIHACRAAYCPQLPPGAARICQLDPQKPPPKGTAPLMALWGELHDAIIRFEIGPEQQRHLLANLSDPKLKAIDRSLHGTPPAPSAKRVFAADGSELPQPVVTITEQALLLWSKSGLEGTQARPVGVFRRVLVENADGTRVKTPVFEYAALNRALLELVKKRWPDTAKRPDESKQIEIQTRGEFPYAVVLEVMKHVQKVREFPGEPRPKEFDQELFPHVQLSALPGLPKPKAQPQQPIRRIRRRYPY